MSTIDNIRDWTVAGSTLAAVILAALAIWRSGRESERAANALVIERRTDFELDLLLPMFEMAAQSNNSMKQRTFDLNLQILGSGRLPICRAAYGFDSTAQAEMVVGTRLADANREPGLTYSKATAASDDLRAEILAEISRLLSLRP
jgi:hypothetical protein